MKKKRVAVGILRDQSAKGVTQYGNIINAIGVEFTDPRDPELDF